MDLYDYLRERFSTFDEGHDISHALTVASNGYQALKDFPDLQEYQRSAVVFACLLHDVNDHKFVKTGDIVSINDLLTKYYPDLDKRIPQLVDEMIELVSCSVNGDSIVFPTWLVIPRYADRVEAMGEIGLQRAVAFSVCKGRPMTLPTTLPVRSLEELKEVATTNRWEDYTQGKSVGESTMDHLYDKVVHIDIPEWFGSSYLRDIATLRRKWLFDYIISYWKSREPQIPY